MARTVYVSFYKIVILNYNSLVIQGGYLNMQRNVHLGTSLGTLDRLINIVYLFWSTYQELINWLVFW